MLAKIYSITSDGLIHTPAAPGRGRPSGTTKLGVLDSEQFALRLFSTYQQLPTDARSKVEVAKAMNISRRTLHRYLDRWLIVWPPTGEVEALIDRLRAEKAGEVAQG